MSQTHKLSFFLRRLTLKSYNTAKTIRFIGTSVTCKDAQPKEKETLVKTSNYQPGLIPYDSSSLSSKISTCTTQPHLFQIINKNHDKMKGREAVRALKTLLGVVNLEGGDKKAITSTEEFRILCEIIKKRVRQLSDTDAVLALRLLCRFDISTSTVIVQMLLQIIRKSVNKLSIEHIHFLICLLPKLEKTPLVRALMTALPIVLRSHIKSELDSENVDILVKLLCQFTGELYDPDSISIVLKRLSRVDKSSMKLIQAKIIMAYIPHSNHDDVSMKVLQTCHEVLIDSMQDIEPHTLTAVVSIISHGTSYGSGILYNKSSLDACAETIISRDMGLRVALITLKHFRRMGHVHNSLLDYVTEKWYEHLEKGGLTITGMPESLIGGVASADYKPRIWDKLEATIENQLLETSSVKALYSAIHLVSIGCYWPKLLEKVFTVRGDYENNEKSSLLLLYNAVKTFYPKYEGPWPSDEILEIYKPRENFSHKETPFRTALECALGEIEYVMTNVKTAMGFTIDHVAMMTKDGVPIAFNRTSKSTSITIEELKRPEDSQLLLFLYIPQQGSLRNIRIHGAYWYLLMRTLEVATDSKVIPLYHEMRQLPNNEKQNYISQAIAEHMNSNVINPSRSQIHECK